MSSSSQYRTIAYAAGASLTAASFVYVVFGPTWFIDSNSSASASQRKKGVVGLANPANDCFVGLL
jgi:ubiquitin carboxyl-terminal hydrolase 16